MSIRLKLSLAIGLLLSSSLLGVGFLLLEMESRNLRQDMAKDERFIVAMVRRAAEDALVQKDDLLLLSYGKFLRQQFPALEYVRITWHGSGKDRTYTVGAATPSPGLESTLLRLDDPVEPGRGVTLDVGINEASMRIRLQENIARTRRNFLRLFGIAVIGALVFADLFARRLSRPLKELSRAAAEIGHGKQGVRLAWKSKDEVGRLVEGFNRMAERLEELDALKKDFVSAVTHELRSPLGAIESFLNLMETKLAGGAPQDPVQFKAYFDRIKQNVRRLSGFINDLLDTAKIERGKMECALKPVKLQGVAADVVQFFEAKAKEQEIAITNRVNPDTGPVQADPERLRQVLVNLVSNALKFTPRGGKIWITTEQYRENGQRFLEVAVQDSGHGISPEDQKRLFQKFAQGKNNTQRIAGSHGTGLGLFIVKAIVEAHGGTISVQSELGKGTRFVFGLKMV